MSDDDFYVRLDALSTFTVTIRKLFFFHVEKKIPRTNQAQPKPSKHQQGSLYIGDQQDRMMSKTNPVRLSRSTSLYELSKRNKYHFQRRSKMGGRSEGDNDAMAFIHAADAATWAIFLQTKLHSDSYRIQSYLHHEPNQNYIPELFCSSQTCAVLVSPMLLEPQHSVFWSRCVERFHRRTVILFLGVDRTELRSALGTSVSDLILSHHCLDMDGSKEAVSRALIKLIEVFESSELSILHSLHEDSDDQEDTEDIYDRPPRPRQQNSLVKVMPRVLYERDSREVLVVMERQADKTLTMVAESCFGPPQQIVLKHVTSSAYLAILPHDLMGKVDITVLSEDEHNFGKTSLQVRSTMEQLSYLLEKETSPLTVLCRALGVAGTTIASETEEFDSMLAKRLAFCQFPRALTNILYPDDQTMADQGTSQWPSLLHFAAEFNLTRVCEELLRYPGTIYAACTENCDGFFPCQLAERNGFTALQKRLVQFVEDMRLRRSAADSGISFSENMPAPSPHTSQGPLYVNERPSNSDLREAADEAAEDYIDMSGAKHFCSGVLSTCQEVVDREGERQETPPAPSPCLRKVTDGYAKPRSYSEGCVKIPCAKTPSEARIAEEDSKETEPPPLKPKVGRAHSTASTYASKPHLNASTRPDSSSSEASVSQEAPQEEHLGKSSTETLSHPEPGASGGSEPRSKEKEEEKGGERVLWTVGPAAERPASELSSTSSQSDCDLSAEQPDTFPDDSPVLRNKNAKRSKSVQDKISHFFKKINPARRLHSSSESDLPTKGQKKPVVYSRQSTSSTNSDPSGYSSPTLSNKFKGADSERDSGAVCDDHQGPSVAMRSKCRDSSTSRNTAKTRFSTRPTGKKRRPERSTNSTC